MSMLNHFFDYKPEVLALDEKALARAVAAELDRRERAKRSRVLSAMSDID